MPKATLTYDLDQPDDRREHMAAVQGMDWALLVFELFNQLRHWEKSPKAFDGPDEVRQWISSEMAERGLDLDNTVY